MADLDRSAIILPIRPSYCNAIFDGTKKIEFRRRLFPVHVERVLMWKTVNVGVVGCFTLMGKTTLPAYAWSSASGKGIEQPDLVAYAGGENASVTGYYIEDVKKLSLTHRLGLTRGPQAWRYAPQGWAEQLAMVA